MHQTVVDECVSSFSYDSTTKAETIFIEWQSSYYLCKNWLSC